MNRREYLDRASIAAMTGLLAAGNHMSTTELCESAWMIACIMDLERDKVIKQPAHETNTNLPTNNG